MSNNRKRKSDELNNEEARETPPEDLDLPSTSSYKSENISHQNIPRYVNNYGNYIQITGNIVHRDASVKAELTAQAKQRELRSISYCYPRKLDKIVGREQDADDILAMLQAADAKPVVICGIGGIGKTSLSNFCAQKWRQQQIILDVAVFSSETECDLTKSIKGFAERIAMNTGNIPAEEIVEMIYERYSESDRKILFIYDNVEKCADIKNYIIPSHLNIYVIATSQNIEMDKIFNIYKIKPLTYQFSLELLKDLITGEDLMNVEELVFTFEGLPLGLRQAAAYIEDKRQYEDNKYTIKDYLNHYKDLFDKLPDNLQINYAKSLHVSLTINIGKVNNVKALALLYCIAQLHSARILAERFDIYNDQLETCNYVRNIRELNEALRTLRKYSLIDITKDIMHTVHVHRIVQQFCRNIMTPDDKFRCLITLLILNMAHEFLNFYIPTLHNLIEDMELDVLTRCLEQILRYHYKNVFEMSLKCFKDKQTLIIDLSVIMQHWNPYHYLFCLDLRDDVMNMMLHELAIKEACTPFNNTSSWRLIHAAALFNTEFHRHNGPIACLLEYIPDAIADINAQTDEGFTPLHLAAALNQYQNVQFLIEKGCDVHMKDNQGNTAFALAAQCNSVETLQELVNNNIFEEILNERENSLIQSINSKSESYKACLNILNSTSGTVIRKLLVVWITKEEMQMKNADVMASTLNKCSWWNEQEKAVLPELMCMLDNNATILDVARAYMINENISVSDLLEVLRKDEPHPVLDIVTEESLYPAARLLFKMFCLVIDTIEKKLPGAYNLLCVLAFFDKFVGILIDVDVNEDILTKEGEFLQKYSLLHSQGDLFPLVGCVARTYVRVRNETRQVFQQVLHRTNKLLNPSLNNKISETVSLEGVYSDEEIDIYLKTSRIVPRISIEMKWKKRYLQSQMQGYL